MFSVLLAVLVSAACGMPEARMEHEFSGRAMGTTFSVKVVSGPLSDAGLQELRGIIETELEFVNRRMSTYLPASELSRLNQHAETDPFPVSPELLSVLTAAREVGSVTGGAFDITVGPLVDTWGFGPQGRPATIPTAERLSELSRITGWDRIRIDDQAGTVTKDSPEVHCDLSGIAKGYGVDRVADKLSAMGYGNHMVEVGGEIRAHGGNRSGAPWRIAIERPVTEGREYQRVVPLRDLAMATSGDYRNYFEENGLRYSHIIDPRTREPIQHRLASVTVVAQFCTQADAFATALLVMGEEKGPEVASQNDVAALFLVRQADSTFVEQATPRFEALFGAVEADTSGGKQ